MRHWLRGATRRGEFAKPSATRPYVLVADIDTSSASLIYRAEIIRFRRTEKKNWRVTSELSSLNANGSHGAARRDEARGDPSARKTRRRVRKKGERESCSGIMPHVSLLLSRVTLCNLSTAPRTDVISSCQGRGCACSSSRSPRGSSRDRDSRTSLTFPRHRRSSRRASNRTRGTFGTTLAVAGISRDKRNLMEKMK